MTTSWVTPIATPNSLERSHSLSERKPMNAASPSPSAAATTANSYVRNYALVTLAYWCDTLADGAIRTLVLFYFYNLGYSAFQVASLFLFYEFFGIVTNFCGGFLGSRFGVKTTLFMGLGTQLAALSML